MYFSKEYTRIAVRDQSKALIKMEFTDLSQFQQMAKKYPALAEVAESVIADYMGPAKSPQEAIKRLDDLWLGFAEEMGEEKAYKYLMITINDYCHSHFKHTRESAAKNNPWSICNGTLPEGTSDAKFERCVRRVKKSLKKK